MSEFSGKGWKIQVGDVRDRLAALPDGHFQTVVTSPPYWGLRDYGVDGQIGLEATPEAFVRSMVDVFREVRRVLRDDGTLWLNIGDSYNAYNGGAGPNSKLSARQHRERPELLTGYGLRDKSLKPKDLVGVPWMLAFALRADGWYLRSEVIWSKRSPMPESVRDRPTKSHEQIFLLSKSERYFYDVVGSSERSTMKDHGNKSTGKYGNCDEGSHRTKSGLHKAATCATRNMRTVWTLSSEPFRGAYFATFPTELVKRCLLAGISPQGCCARCGSAWNRNVKKVRVATRPGDKTKIKRPSGWNAGEGSHDTIDGRYDYRDSIEVGNRDPQRHVTHVKTLGWVAGCSCGEASVPCRVLDPFSGAGTTLLVARRLFAEGVGIELNADYAAMAARRIVNDAPLWNT